jgi:hypothetical protein
VTERAPTATAEELELSKVIAADAGCAAQNSRTRRENPEAIRLNGFTRGTLLFGVVVFMTDSFSLTRNQELFSASGKFRNNEAAKRADCSADQCHTQEKARRKSGIQNFKPACATTKPHLSSTWPCREADGPREGLSPLASRTEYHLTSSP